MVSKARLDLPEPETPVTTVMALWGISKLIFLRLCTRAPETTMEVGSSMTAAGAAAVLAVISGLSGLSGLSLKAFTGKGVYRRLRRDSSAQPGFWGQSKRKIIRRGERGGKWSWH